MKRTGNATITDRTTLAVLVGCACGAMNLFFRLSGRFSFSDFDQIWIAGRAVLHGNDPYMTVANHFAWPLYYPMPAVIVGLPFTVLPMVWAQAAWTAVGFGLLAFAVSARGPWLLVALLTYPAINAIELAQWSPIVAAAAVLPWLAWIAIGKPTSASATVLAYGKPWSSRTVFGVNALVCLVILSASFALVPAWVSEWWSAIHAATHFTPIVTRPGGIILLASLVRWRRPEARLLALLSIVPLTATAYEALPLVLVPATRAEALIVAVLGCLVPLIEPNDVTYPTLNVMLAAQWPYLLALVYIPALVLILRRPNE